MMTGRELWRTIPGFVRVGTLGKTHGTEGDLKIRIDKGREEDIVSSGFLFVDLHGSKVPFRLASFRQTRDLLVSFESVDRVEVAARLAGCALFLPSDETTQQELPGPEQDLEYGYLKDFTVVYAGNEVGIIAEVREFPQQEMGVVHREGREILIPLHADLILMEDRDLRRVDMDLPEGLLEL